MRADRRTALKLAAFLLLLVGAHAVPRALTIRGVGYTSPLRFGDMTPHLFNLDRVWRSHFASGSPLEHPYFREVPRAAALQGSDRWPQGVYHVASLWTGLFGPLSIWSTQLTNLLFTILLVGGVIGLGRAMGSLQLGLWAALITLVCPALVASSWYFSLDYPLIAMVVVGLLLLWWTDGFQRRSACLLFAVWSGLGLCVKQAYALYLAAPCLVVLVAGLRGASSRLRVAAHAVAGGLLALGTSALLQGWAPRSLWEELRGHFAGQLAPFPEEQSFWPALLALPRFAGASFPWPLLLLVVPGLVLLHVRRGPAPRWMLLSFFWGSAILFTLMPNRMERYFQPLYPLFCLLTVWSLWLIVPGRWRMVALSWLAAAYAAVLWLAFEHPTPWHVDRHSAEQDWYKYELSMPGAAVLDGLRRRTYHPTCDLRALAGRMVEVARLDRSNGPLGLVLQWDSHEPSVRVPPPGLHEMVYLLAAQLLRERIVLFPSPDYTRSPHPQMLRAPSVMVIHSPSLDVEGMYPFLSPVARRDTMVDCADGQLRAAVSLLRRRQATAP